VLPGRPVTERERPPLVEPDLDFLRSLRRQAGPDFKKCFQCGTCSSTCDLSPAEDPFPRKEMAWAAWGLKDRLVRDADVWLCHQCNDCTVMCPRGGRPGDVMAAAREATVLHYAFPRTLARWAHEPHSLPLLLAVPFALLALALALRKPIEEGLGLGATAGERIVFPYSVFFPHWLLNGLFLSVTGLVLLAGFAGALRFRAGLGAFDRERGAPGPIRGRFASFLSALRIAFGHRDFAVCTAARPRMLSHSLVLYGFLGLLVVTLFVITAPVNPLVRGSFVYPFSFFSPLKILANAAGAAVLAGAVLMIVRRLTDRSGSRGAFSDWLLLGGLVLVVVTGFASELFHYLRLEPHRHVIYFTHLAFALGLIVSLPFSKLAHVVYRIVAIAHAERRGRTAGRKPVAPKEAVHA
jgi:quinone-modifying oxidoreductase subunit QmoC